MKFNLYGYNGKKEFSMPEFPEKLKIRNLFGDEVITATYPNGGEETFSAGMRDGEWPEEAMYVLSDQNAIRAFFAFPEEHQEISDRDMEKERMERFIFSEDVPVDERHITVELAFQHMYKMHNLYAADTAEKFVEKIEDTGPENIVERGILSDEDGSKVVVEYSENRQATFGYIDMYPVKGEEILYNAPIYHEGVYGTVKAYDSFDKAIVRWAEGKRNVKYEEIG